MEAGPCSEGFALVPSTENVLLSSLSVAKKR